MAQIKAIEKKNRIDLTGQRFGRLLVLGRAEDYVTAGGKNIKRWVCKCDCGNITIVRHGNLRSGKTKSCGCLHSEVFGSLNRTHGLSSKCGRLYPLWKSIKHRCYCENAKEYANYGGRGITMCDEWKDDFKSFHDWAIANGYKEEKTDKGINILTIDRIDVNGNYCPENCRFVTNEVQARNKRNSIRSDEMYKVCPVCGKEFKVTSRNHAKTCSVKCGSKLRGENRQSVKDYTKICPICGKEYDAKRDGHYKKAVYCSTRCKNLSNSPIWEYGGESHRVIEWGEILGISSHCLLHRKELGWTIEEIINTPIRGKRNAKAELQTDLCNQREIQETTA